jgi:adenosylcobinamide-phosphate synthase
LNGYGGGVLMCVLTVVFWCSSVSILVVAADRLNHAAGVALHAFLLYSLLALRNLLDHAWAVERAARENDLKQMRFAISRFVTRDTDQMTLAQGRRAAIESVSENYTDGYLSPLFWYAVGGLPAIVLFKVASTLDSMIGNKSPRYIRFGWCSARTDDVLNWLPARMSWLLIALTATFIPRCSASKALRIGLTQHAILPSPNSGWSEAATAGAIQRRLIGPIFRAGQLVTDVWLGDPHDPPAGDDRSDVVRAMTLCAATGVASAALFIVMIGAYH